MLHHKAIQTIYPARSVTSRQSPSPPGIAHDPTLLEWRASAIEDLLARAAREIKVLAASTPVEAHIERRRLEQALQAGREASPCWSYAPRPHDALRRALEVAERSLSSGAGPEACSLDALYLARVRELSIEAALCAATGTEALAALAAARFAPGDAGAERAAAELCARWLELPDDAPAGGDDAPRIRTDDAGDPGSLLSLMRAAVGAARLPFAVVTSESLAPLAATAERAVIIAAGRMVSREDAARTVLHELEGHARPRVRSASARCVLFRAGTARGVDHQEGRALLLEERAGRLDPRRRRQLAARHRAAELMRTGATFDDVARTLVHGHGVAIPEAVLVAERVFRGSDGRRPGLGRERVYLESFVQVRAHLAARPEDEAVMAAGQVALDAIEALRSRTPPGPGDGGDEADRPDDPGGPLTAPVP